MLFELLQMAFGYLERAMAEALAGGEYAEALGEAVAACLEELHSPLEQLLISLPDAYVEHGNVDLLYEEVGIDAASVVKRVVTAFVCIQQK